MRLMPLLTLSRTVRPPIWRICVLVVIRTPKPALSIVLAFAISKTSNGVASCFSSAWMCLSSIVLRTRASSPMTFPWISKRVKFLVWTLICIVLYCPRLRSDQHCGNVCGQLNTVFLLKVSNAFVVFTKLINNDIFLQVSGSRKIFFGFFPFLQV